MYDLWIRGAEDKKLTAALLLDLSAAFDVVDHGILVDKLKLYNFEPAAVAWFESYLEDRYQYVMVEASLSDRKPVGRQSVPQGSILGPLLFSTMTFRQRERVDLVSSMQMMTLTMSVILTLIHFSRLFSRKLTSQHPGYRITS